MDELSDDELLEALGVVVEAKKPGGHTPREDESSRDLRKSSIS